MFILLFCLTIAFVFGGFLNLFVLFRINKLSQKINNYLGSRWALLMLTTGLGGFLFIIICFFISLYMEFSLEHRSILLSFGIFIGWILGFFTGQALIKELKNK